MSSPPEKLNLELQNVQAHTSHTHAQLHIGEELHTKLHFVCAPPPPMVFAWI